MFYTATAFMFSILILNNDTLLQMPINGEWKIPAYVLRDNDLLSRNSNDLSHKSHSLSRNNDSQISRLRELTVVYDLRISS